MFFLEQILRRERLNASTCNHRSSRLRICSPETPGTATQSAALTNTAKTMRFSPVLLAVAAHALAPLPRAKNLGRRGAVVSEPETKSNARSYADLTIGVVPESDPTENRVAQTPESLALLVKAGFNAKVASGAGASAGFSDDMYKKIGAQITTEDEAWASRTS